MSEAKDPVEVVRAYHERTKHQPARFARSLGYMDWDTQPDPFRRHAGAILLPLDLVPVEDSPRYEPAFVERATSSPAGIATDLPISPRASTEIAVAPVDRRSVSRLFQDSLGLSAWKEAGGSRWALRVNPSSGNLHPTEGHLVAGPVEGLASHAGVYHYAPREHALELRAELPEPISRRLFALLPEGALLVGLSTIAWREAWKYGERAFRYCHHDVGHAIAAVAVAAAGLGWKARLVEGFTGEQMAALLGLRRTSPPWATSTAEAEDPDCLIAVYPSTAPGGNERGTWDVTSRCTSDLAKDLEALVFAGAPNVLSAEHHAWPVIDEVAEATQKTSAPGASYFQARPIDNPALVVGDSALSLRAIVHSRRSAIALDGRTGITRAAFFQILIKAMPGAGQVPFASLPFRPRVDLLLFVHRVEDLRPGLYVLCRDPERVEVLKAILDPGFAWSRAEGAPPSLPLFLLEAGDARPAAEQVSCGQAIAKDGVFAAAMLAELRRSLSEHGAWFYRRLHWEAGALGQLLYLEAEASGIRGTGIGCYFDDATHRIFGLRDDTHQVLYHFTMGGPVDDDRLRTLAPYAHLPR